MERAGGGQQPAPLPFQIPLSTHGANRRLRILTTHALSGARRATSGGARYTLATTPVATRPYGHYDDLLGALEQRRGDRELRVLGHTPDGSPLVVVKCGGDKLPAVFISAGAHSPEQAGVTAAVELIDEIRTEHAVYILPCRDPIGLNGFAHALAMGMGARLPPGQQPRSQADVADLLREKGEVIYDEAGRVIALIGDYAYTVYNPPGFNGTSMIVAGDPALTHGPVHEALLGKRIYWPTNYGEPGSDLITGEFEKDDFHRGFEHDASLTQVEGAAPMERAYTQFGTSDDIFHINRFHDTPWAPIEVRCARNVMAEVQPRLVVDLHEHNGDDFWMSARHQVHSLPGARRQVHSGPDRVLDVHAEDEDCEIEMAQAVSKAVSASGVPLHEPGRTGNGGGKSFFHDLGPGVFWLDAGQRGEGLNLADFGADQYGMSFTVETGMFLPFASRVATAKLTVQTLLDVFAQRYA